MTLALRAILFDLPDTPTNRHYKFGIYRDNQVKYSFY
jgi:hypothetical protein